MDDLRSTCAEISRRARWVRVREDRIDAYAASLPLPPPDATAEPMGPAGTAAERAGYWLSLDAINFGSGWFPTLRKRDGQSGYRTIAGGWQARYEADGPIAAAALATITAEQVAEITGQDPAHALIELYALSLRDPGHRLHSEFDGDPLAPIDAAHGSAVALATHLGGWPCFADRSRYHELSVGFLKRAQLAAANLQRAQVVRWDDLDALTMFADNLVPHVLRLDGVLAFDPELTARIQSGALIDHGCAEEVEIRACAVHAVELLVAARGGRHPAAAIDELLWNRGQQPSYKAISRHRSRCTAY